MKISNIVIFLILITFTGSNSFAETREDCSKFSTDTVQGTIKKMKCEKREGKGITSKLAQKLKEIKEKVKEKNKKIKEKVKEKNKQIKEKIKKN